MANEEQLKILRQGVGAWNNWREKNSDVLHPNLEGANLEGAYLDATDLRGANLLGARLRGAYLCWADLFGADLRSTDLRGACLWGTDLSGADLYGAYLYGAQLIGTDLRNARLTGSRVYGASVWSITVDERTQQQNLIITSHDEPVITVDNIKVAQFVYLLLNNQEIRDVIDTITSKAVLILGRFSEERKPVLDAIREELRKHDYLPILFDFPPEDDRSTIETITTLARMTRFVIADLTDARSVLQELQAIVPDLPSVAVRLMIKRSEHEYGMLDHIRRFRSVVGNTYKYKTEEEVIASITTKIIEPAEAKVRQLRPRERRQREKVQEQGPGN